MNHTKLTDLIKKFLIAGVDSYNSGDLTISDGDTQEDTLGERARMCINLALSKIYGLIKDSKYLEALPAESVQSIAGQDYISLDTISQVDDVESVVDTDNDFQLTRKSWDWYRENYSDPSSNTGTPNVYIIRNDRLYFAPRPSSAVNYTVDFKKLTTDLVLANDVPLIPTQYDGWIIAEGRVQWYLMEDPNTVPAILLSERNDIQQISMDSILTGYNMERVARSHFDRTEAPKTTGYDRPSD